MRTTALAFSSIQWSAFSPSRRPSGMTWKTEPMVTSEALIGRAGRVEGEPSCPRFHSVCRNVETFQSPPTSPISGTATVSGDEGEGRDDRALEHAAPGDARVSSAPVREDLDGGGPRPRRCCAAGAGPR